jgi:hypothetical protein
MRKPYAFDQAFATMAEAHADALITLPSGLFGNRRTQIVTIPSTLLFQANKVLQ